MHGWPPQEYGGVGLYVQALAIALQKQGHNISILVPGLKQKSTSFSWGTLHKISFPEPQNWNETWFQNKREVERQINMHFDVVHVHHLGHWPLTIPLHIPAQKIFITLHDYAIICARGQLYRPKKGICAGPSTEKCTSCIRDQLFYTPSVPKISSFLQRLPRIRSAIKKILRTMPTRTQNKSASNSARSVWIFVTFSQRQRKQQRKPRQSLALLALRW